MLRPYRATCFDLDFSPPLISVQQMKGKLTEMSLNTRRAKPGNRVVLERVEESREENDEPQDWGENRDGWGKEAKKIAHSLCIIVFEADEWYF